MNRSGFIAVPYAIVGNQVEPSLEHLDYPAPYIQTNDNGNQKLGSNFSANAEPLGILMGIGVDSLLCHQ